MSLMPCELQHIATRCNTLQHAAAHFEREDCAHSSLKRHVMSLMPYAFPVCVCVCMCVFVCECMCVCVCVCVRWCRGISSYH